MGQRVGIAGDAYQNVLSLMNRQGREVVRRCLGLQQGERPGPAGLEDRFDCAGELLDASVTGWLPQVVDGDSNQRCFVRTFAGKPSALAVQVGERRDRWNGA